MENITENKEDNDIRDLSIIMPANSLSIGQSGDFPYQKMLDLIPAAFHFQRCTRRMGRFMCMLQTQKIQCLER